MDHGRRVVFGEDKSGESLAGISVFAASGGVGTVIVFRASRSPLP
jgi:hypothetical protein